MGGGETRAAKGPEASPPPSDTDERDCRTNAAGVSLLGTSTYLTVTLSTAGAGLLRSFLLLFFFVVFFLLLRFLLGCGELLPSWMLSSVRFFGLLWSEADDEAECTEEEEDEVSFPVFFFFPTSKTFPSLRKSEEEEEEVDGTVPGPIRLEGGEQRNK